MTRRNRFPQWRREPDGRLWGDGPHLIRDLYEALASDGPGVRIFEALIQAWDAYGDQASARGIAEQLLRLDRGNTMALNYLQRNRPPRNIPDHRSHNISAPPTSTRTREPSTMAPKEEDRRLGELESGYKSLMDRAEVLYLELSVIPSSLRQASGEDELDPLEVLQMIREGNTSAIVGPSQPPAVSQLAKHVLGDGVHQSQETVMNDFEDVIAWDKSRDPPLDEDAIRSHLLKRGALLAAALPEEYHPHIDTAMTQVELQCLNKEYINSETMLGDLIKDIPKDRFFVSTDNYAWDMSELVQALSVNDGVMRNPLSRDMFSAEDISKICNHPLGHVLRPLRQAQDKLRQGVHTDTITKVESLSQILLYDQSENMGPSRVAMDEFIAYVAMLPETEQQTISSLKIPATDKYTRQPYDLAIGESVKDAKANVTCSHKVGDFLSQAASYLKSFS